VELLAQRIPLREQLTDAADELVCLDEIIEDASDLAQALRELAHGESSSTRPRDCRARPWRIRTTLSS
jgi:hypothetical protein